MSSRSDLPRARIERECARRGRAAFVVGCVDLLEGHDTDPELVSVLAGRSASWALSVEDGRHDHWIRVWAVRGLLWAWDDVALPALTTALGDDAWRVREMALKVVTRHLVDDTLPVVAELQHDPTARVRAAAGRALIRLARAAQPPDSASRRG